ncbi:MAG: DUF2283 domain-containing protein [Syntrophobacterales bacterium]|nr:DUF2283 domain-containing protein [Syntrophobacterales bacterium]
MSELRHPPLKKLRQTCGKGCHESFYDPEVDILRIFFSSQAIEESDEDKPGGIIDYDKEGNIGGSEVWRHPSGLNSRTLEYAVAEGYNFQAYLVCYYRTGHKNVMKKANYGHQ